jgi:hypothetical protein
MTLCWTVTTIDGRLNRDRYGTDGPPTMGNGVEKLFGLSQVRVRRDETITVCARSFSTN